jgi:peptidyl-prolyl cis-trans isomerase D
MAIFNQINKHSRIVGIVIGAGLLLFILGNEFFGPNSLFGRKSDSVGKINGNTISREEYAQQLAKTETDYMIRSGKSITENERASVQEQAWNELILKYVYQPQYNDLGLTVTEEEVVEMVQGKNIHPTIRQLFANPQTQQFDKTFLKDFLSTFNKREPRDQQLWTSVEASLTPDRLRSKYAGLFRFSNYVTREEAKREYTNQNAKAEAKFVYVSYYTVADSTIKISDGEIKDYIDNNKEKYKVEEGRSLEYISIPINPSGKDSAIFKKELQDLTSEFKTTENDSLFVSNNSDNPAAPRLVGIGQLPEELKSSATTLQSDSVYGPFAAGSKYVLYKVLGSKNDTIFSAKASHILFKPKGNTPAEKAEAEKQANEVLAKIKGGDNFELLASIYGTDGTKSRGGDLGWFSQGQMVKNFNDAVFNTTAPGLLPKLVETDFGYHIIKITESKTNKKYLLATLEREIVPTEETKDIAFKKADTFAGSIHDTAEFNAAVKKEPGLARFNAKNIKKTDRNLNAIPNPREIIRWAFNDAKVNTVSSVFTLDNAYVVAILTGKREKGTASADDVRDEVTVKLRNEKKGDVIIEKLKGIQGSLDKVASKYGTQAIFNTAKDLTFSANSIAGLGYEPIAVGKIFGLDKGKRSQPFKGDNGVAIVELINIIPAPEIADYAVYKTQLQQQRAGREDYNVDEALKKSANIEDDRYKFF